MQDKITVTGRISESLHKVMLASPRTNQDIIVGGIEKELLAQHDESLAIKLAQEQRRAAYLEKELGELTSELEDCWERIEEMKAAIDATQPAVEEAADLLQDNQLEPDNAAVVNWAEKAGLPVHDFLERVLEARDE